MSNDKLSEVIRLQAEAVKNLSNREKAAELLRQAADLLNSDAQPKKEGISHMPKMGLSALEKFKSSASDTLKKEARRKQATQIHSALTDMGYKAAHGEIHQGNVIYQHTKSPEDRVSIRGNDFAILKHSNVTKRGQLKDLMHSLGYYKN